jgi:hypothetical protein
MHQKFIASKNGVASNLLAKNTANYDILTKKT